jgi:hypothetical protein
VVLVVIYGFFYVLWISNVVGFTFEQLHFVICMFIILFWINPSWGVCIFFVIFKLKCEIKIWNSFKTLRLKKKH